MQEIQLQVQKEVTVSNTLHRKALQLFPSNYTLAEFTNESKIQPSIMWNPSFPMAEYLSSVMTLYSVKQSHNYLTAQSVTLSEIQL